MINVGQDGCLFGYYTDTDAESIYADYGAKKRSFYNANHTYLLDFGWCEEGSSITVTTSEGESLLLTPYRMDLDVFAQAYDRLNRQTMQTETFTSNQISGVIDVLEEGNLLLSIPNEAGWSIEVDGEKRESKGFFGAFLEVPLEKGRHHVRLSYRTPGILTGMCISVGSVALFAAIYVRSRKKVT